MEPGAVDVDFTVDDVMQLSDPVKTEPITQTQNPFGTQDDDAKSDTSFDPLFDDPDGADDGSDTEAKQAATIPTQPATQLSMPQSASQPALPSRQSQRQAFGAGAAAPAPKNAPPVLDSLSYSMFSPDVLMTASIDGQVMLWDRRLHTPGRGVGRLWMSEKTPPWCVSVSRSPSCTKRLNIEEHIRRLVGAQTAHRSMRGGATGRLMFGMSARRGKGSWVLHVSSKSSGTPSLRALFPASSRSRMVDISRGTYNLEVLAGRHQ